MPPPAGRGSEPGSPSGRPTPLERLALIWPFVALVVFGGLALASFPWGDETATVAFFVIWLSALGVALLLRAGSLLLDHAHMAAAALGLRTRRAPRRYIETLFDGYAERYEEHLLVHLRYQGPNLLRGIVGNRAGTRVGRVVDLGCGTGICGPLFRGLADVLEGVDLSPESLARARAKRCYDGLFEGDILDYLRVEAEPGSVDLFIAADVLCYFGALEPVFGPVRRALAPGGFFAFTVEAAPDAGWSLARTGRYRHDAAYVRAAAARAGLAVEAMEDADLRLQSDRPVPGTVWLLRSPG